MTVVFWDVQHGHAIYVRSPNGKHIVVDLGTGTYGSGNAAFSPLLHLNQYWNVSGLHYLIITHPHRDHIDDILNLYYGSPHIFRRPDHLTADDVLVGVSPQDRPKYEKYLALSQGYTGLVAGHPDDPSVAENYGGLAISTFGPVTCSRSNLNNHSVVSVFSYAGLKVVIPGDNESCSFKELLSSALFTTAVAEADILLAPHHGRQSGFHADFVNLVHPRLTVISDGPFGDTSATARYSAASRGWQVNKRSGGTGERKCVTTRRDGVIRAEIGYHAEGVLLSVTVD